MSDDKFQDRLMRARSALGMSQADLSKASGISATQLSRYEGGLSEPRSQAVGKLAKALNVDFDWLLMGKTAIEAPAENLGLGTLTVRLPVELLAKLEVAAKNEVSSVEEVVRERLERSLNNEPYKLSFNPTFSVQNRDGSSTELTLEELAQRLATQMVKEQEKKSRGTKKPA